MTGAIEHWMENNDLKRAFERPDVVTMLRELRGEIPSNLLPVDQELAIDTARRVTMSRRQDAYGHPLINFLRIAILKTVYYSGLGKLKRGAVITPQEAAWDMTLLKLAREQHIHQQDNVVDFIGYASCVDRINRWMLAAGFEDGAAWFDTASLNDMRLLMDDILAGQYDDVKSE